MNRLVTCSKDPIGYRGGLNLFRYVDSNPFYWLDPSGLAKTLAEWVEYFREHRPQTTEEWEAWDEIKEREAFLKRIRENEKHIWGQRIVTMPIDRIVDPIYYIDLFLQDVDDWRYGTDRTVDFRYVPDPNMIIAVDPLGGIIGRSPRLTPAQLERGENIARGIPESNLGPSGKPKIHTVDHPTRKQAKDAARNDGKGKPILHPNDVDQPPHFHAVDADGNKIGQQSPHHNFPCKQK